MFGEPRPAEAARGVGATGLDPWQLQDRVLRRLEQEGRLQLPRAQAALLATGALLHALVRR